MIIYFYHLGYVILCMRRKRKKMHKKRSFRQGKGGRVEGFQTSTCLGGYLESLYSTHDVGAFCAAVTVWCREPEQKDSWFNYIPCLLA